MICNSVFKRPDVATNSADTDSQGNPKFNIGDLFRSGAPKLDVENFIDEMTDSELFGKRGELYFVVQAIIGIMLLFPPDPLENIVRVLGGIAVVAGLGLAFAGLESLGNSLSPFPAPRDRDHELVQTGIYAYTRHPMYAALLLMAFGLSAATGDDLRFALSFLLLYLLDKKTKIEEDALTQRYPDFYPDYKERVKRFFPFIY